MIFVNTLFGCLATFSPRASFQPLWRPPFLSALVPEDRCHLNGLAMRDGRPAYVTAVAASDVADGWRDRRRDGGCVIDVASGGIVASGLSMPHSPRWYRDRLWVLNSGTGEFGSVAAGGGDLRTRLVDFPGIEALETRVLLGVRAAAEAIARLAGMKVRTQEPIGPRPQGGK